MLLFLPRHSRCQSAPFSKNRRTPSKSPPKNSPEKITRDFSKEDARCPRRRREIFFITSRNENPCIGNAGHKTWVAYAGVPRQGAFGEDECPPMQERKDYSQAGIGKTAFATHFQENSGAKSHLLGIDGKDMRERLYPSVKKIPNF